MKKLLLSLFGLVTLAWGSAPTTAPYYYQDTCPVLIVNNTGVADTDVYMVVYGLDLCGNPCFLDPLYPNNGGLSPYIYLTSSPTPSSISSTIKLSQLTKVAIPATSSGSLPFGLPSGTQAYLWYMPSSQACRGFFSLYNQVYLPITYNPARELYDVNSPSVTSYSDPNTYTFYQHFEFGLVPFANETAARHLYLNLSYVDYFCLPMTLGAFSSSTSSTYSGQPIYGVLSSGFNPTDSSANLTTLMNSLVSQLNSVSTTCTNVWGNLSEPFYTDPYTDTTPALYLRLLAAKNSLGLGNSSVSFTGAAKPWTYFPSDYVNNNASYGPKNGSTSTNNFFQNIYSYYSTTSATNFSPFYFTILPADSNGIWVTYSMSSGTFPSSSDQALIFTYQNAYDPATMMSTSKPGGAPTTAYLDINPATTSVNGFTTEQLLSGGGSTIYESDGTTSIDSAYTNEIAKMLSALFTSGMLPWKPSSGTVGSTANPFVVATYGTTPSPLVGTFGNFQYFYSTANSPAGYNCGPWQNMYDIFLHKKFFDKGQLPNNTLNTNLGQAYAYDYDDLLGMAGLTPGTLVQTDLGSPITDAYSMSQGKVLAYPFALMILDPIGTETIPIIANDTYSYATIINPAPGGVTVTFYYYTSASGTQQSVVASSLSAEKSIGSVYVDATHPFKAYFQFNGNTYAYYVNLQRQMATYDTTDSTTGTEYGTVQQYFQEGIVFNVTTTAQVPSFTISVNSTPPPWSSY